MFETAVHTKIEVSELWILALTSKEREGVRGGGGGKIEREWGRENDRS